MEVIDLRIIDGVKYTYGTKKNPMLNMSLLHRRCEDLILSWSEKLKATKEVRIERQMNKTNRGVNRMSAHLQQGIKHFHPHIQVKMYFPRTIRSWFGTKADTRPERKDNSRRKLREILGETQYGHACKMFTRKNNKGKAVGKVYPDAYEAALMCLYPDDPPPYKMAPKKPKMSEGTPSSREVNMMFRCDLPTGFEQYTRKHKLETDEDGEDDTDDVEPPRKRRKADKPEKATKRKAPDEVDEPPRKRKKTATSTRAPLKEAKRNEQKRNIKTMLMASAKVVDLCEDVDPETAKGGGGQKVGGAR